MLDSGADGPAGWGRSLLDPLVTPPLPSLGPRLDAVRRALAAPNGLGFVLIRGLPVDEISRELAVAAFVGLGRHIGFPVAQNAMGHMVGHVTDHGDDPADPAVRIYRTAAAQRFHTDSADVVGLLCLSQPEEGGMSSIASSPAIYHHMRQLRPRLAAELEAELHWDRKNEVPPGKGPTYLGPVFNHHRGRLLTIYDRRFFATAARHPGPSQTPRSQRSVRQAVGWST